VFRREMPADPQQLRKEISSIIDHTNLKPDATEKELEATCREAVEYGFYACCIPSFYVEKAAKEFGGQVRIVTVAGFPHGNSHSSVKIREVETAYVKGAVEVDVVANISLLRAGLYSEALEEIKEMLDIARSYGGMLKVIVETGYFSGEEIFRIARELAHVGVHYVKTCTGFGPRGAAPEDVLTIKRAVQGTTTKVKAAGGIRTGLQALLFYLLGADRIGTSSSVKILKDLECSFIV
jgi:deoxyribose-phosphate aldolase